MFIPESFRLIYIVGAANALFFSILLFSKRDKSTSDRILGLWLIILFLQLAIPALYLTNIQNDYSYAGIEITLYVFHPLFLYLYVKSMVGEQIKRKLLLWNIAAVLIYEILCTIYFLYPAKERLLIIEGKKPLSFWYFIPFTLIMVVYFTWNIRAGYKSLRDFKDNVLQVYSYRENVDLLWLRRLIVLFAMICVFVFPIGLISYFGFRSMIFADYFFFVTLVVFVFFLGFWGYQQGKVFNINEHTTQDKSSSETSQQTPEENTLVEKRYKSEAKSLDKLMNEEKPYLNPTLTIHDLASMAGMPPHQLSKVINGEFNCNFFEYINHYRIEDFKIKAFASEYKHLTILAIAFDCGFNSKSAFNRIFKDMTGLTPREFITHHKS